ncbi:alpha/beta fold hydrolase [Herbiconiux solani]|uniref:alpha/beta fold hydrolase n=1 Tax=Herbiconiux solani TaxID=661329 RepID=UPI0008255B4C|nr:alpha/beta hydrolase [Herbiconiux solani]
MTDTLIFDADGRGIAYAEEGSGPALVLLPEKGSEIGYLGALAHSVSAEDFRVIRMGSRAGDASLSELAQDVVDLLDALDVKDAWIGGHGFGGSIARIVAIEHHDRVNGVILFGVESGENLPALAEGLPVLVIQGTEDDANPPANGEALRDSAPGLVSVVPIEGGGHDFPAAHVGETSWAIEDYLDWD